MRSRNFIFYLLAFTAFSVAASAQDGTGTRTVPDANAMAWFAGCWELRIPQQNTTMTEIWTKPDGDTLFGIGRTVTKGKTASYEYMRIEVGKDKVEYVVNHSGSSGETAFRLTSWTTDEVVFENPANDFPQKIIYRKKNADGLFARIEATKDKQTRGMDIPMTRIKCE